MLGRASFKTLICGLLVFSVSEANFANACYQDDDVGNILDAAEREPLSISERHLVFPRTISNSRKEKFYVVYLAKDSDPNPKSLAEAQAAGAYYFDSAQEARAFSRSQQKGLRETGYHGNESWRFSVIKEQIDSTTVDPASLTPGPAQHEALQRLKNMIVEVAGDHGIGGGARRQGITSLQLVTMDVSGFDDAEKQGLSLWPSISGSTLNLTSVVGDPHLARKVDYANRSLLRLLKETDEFTLRLSERNSKPLELEFHFGGVNFSRDVQQDYMSTAAEALNEHIRNMDPETTMGFSGYDTLAIRTHDRNQKGASAFYADGTSLVVSIGIDTSMSTTEVGKEAVDAFKSAMGASTVRGQKPMTDLQKALR